MSSAQTFRVAHCVVDEAFVVVEADDHYCEIVGRDRAELRRTSVLEFTHPADRPDNALRLDELKRRDTPFGIQKRYVRPDGSFAWVRSHVAIVRDGLVAPKLIAIVQPLKLHAESGQPEDLVRTARAVMARRAHERAQLDGRQFGDPALDILLRLFVDEQDRAEVPVSAACAATSAPTTTALRQIVRLEERGLVSRATDEADRRRSLLSLSEAGRDAVVAFLRDTEQGSR